MSERYRLIRPLGGGGMAEVFLAVALGEEGFEKPVAIKRVLPHLARDEAVAKMFIAEAKLSMHLHHQNVVEVFDVGRGADGLFLVMELVNGWDLAEILSRTAGAKPFSDPVAAFIGAQICAGLVHAYSQKLGGKPIITAHRDISPSNVLVSIDGEIKVADFGIAKVEAFSEKERTEAGTFKGKIPYSAPEVISGDPPSDQSDQFSLGVVLHRLLTNQHPFGHTDNLVQYAQHLALSAPPPLPDVSPALADILRKLLAYEPKNRFPSMSAVAQALTAFVARSGEPVSSQTLADLVRGLALPPPPLTGWEETKSQPSVPAAPAPREIHFDSDWQPPDVALDASGRIQGKPGAVVPTPKRIDVPTPAAPPRAPEAPLELTDEGEQWRARQVLLDKSNDPAPDYTPGEYVRRRPLVARLAIALALLLALAGVGLAAIELFPQLGGAKLREVTRPKALVLNVESEPDGATVKIDGTPVGTTPLFLDNVYPPKEIPITVSLRGYQTWSGTFRGGSAQTITAHLTRKR